MYIFELTECRLNTKYTKHGSLKDFRLVIMNKRGTSFFLKIVFFMTFSTPLRYKLYFQKMANNLGILSIFQLHVVTDNT